MADIAEVLDLMCIGLPTRGSTTSSAGIDDWLVAETAAFLEFRSDFLSRNPGGIVVNQLTYKNIAKPSDPDTQFVLDALQVYFRNWWSPRNVSREGGFRKPDGLGISSGGTVIEIIEVKPVKYYQDGVDQLNDMITRIRQGLQATYDEKSIESGMSPSFNPSYATTVKGSPWKPSGQDLVFPLFGSGNNEIAWICFKPTKRPLADSTVPIDGVILYEIHNIPKPQFGGDTLYIPQDLAQRLAQAHRARLHARGQPLQLLPWASAYARQNAADAEALRQAVAILGVAAVIGVVAVVILTLAPEAAPIVAEEAPQVVEILVQTGGYRVAPILIRVAASEYEAAESSEALVKAAQAAIYH